MCPSAVNKERNYFLSLLALMVLTSVCMVVQVDWLMCSHVLMFFLIILNGYYARNRMRARLILNCFHITLIVLFHKVNMSLCSACGVFVGSCLATKVFIGNLPAMGRGWVIIK